MADRIVKPDTGNDLVLQNDDASAKIEINEAGTVVATPSFQVDNIKIDGNAITSENTNGNIDLTPNGTGEVNISKVDIDSGTIDGTDVTVGASKTLDVSAGTFTSSTAQKQAIVQSGPGSGTLDVSSGTFTTSTAQKQAIVQAGPGSGTLDVSSGTFTTSTAQKQAIVQAGPGSGTLDVSSGTFTSSTAQKQAIIDGASIEGTAIKSTTETGGTKFLRENGDGTCSFHTVSGTGSGQLIHLETKTLSSQEVAAFEAKLTSTYNTYLLIGNKIKPDTDNKRLEFQFGVGSAGSVTYRNTEYYTQAQKIETGSWNSVINESNVSAAVVGGFGSQGSATNEFSYFQAYLFNTQESGVRSMGSTSAGGYKNNAEFIYTVGGFVNTQVEVHTSLRVKFESNTVGQGIFSLYGIKNG